MSSEQASGINCNSCLNEACPHTYSLHGDVSQTSCIFAPQTVLLPGAFLNYKISNKRHTHAKPWQ